MILNIIIIFLNQLIYTFQHRHIPTNKRYYSTATEEERPSLFSSLGGRLKKLWSGEVNKIVLVYMYAWLLNIPYKYLETRATTPRTKRTNCWWQRVGSFRQSTNEKYWNREIWFRWLWAWDIPSIETSKIKQVLIFFPPCPSSKLLQCKRKGDWSFKER